MVIKKYTFQSNHGSDNFQISLALNTDHLPICFDTFMDWIKAHIQPKYRHMAWKLILEEEFTGNNNCTNLLNDNKKV